jgi:hypothetical protein
MRAFFEDYSNEKVGMSRKIFHLTNFTAILGAATIGYALYASSQHAMSWTKLMIFWIGFGGIASFLIYHIFARLPGKWQGRPIRRYGLLHRANCAALLLVGLFAATGFSYRTWLTWQLPALYWEPMAVNKIGREHFEFLFTIGNQRDHHALHLREIQLIALDNPSQPDTGINATLHIDSLNLPLRNHTASPPRFMLDDALLLPPLERRILRLNFETGDDWGIYQILAVYRENGNNTNGEHSFEPYFLLGPQEAAFIDFAGVMARGRQPSYATQSHFIYAMARSRNPLALNALLELLKVRDVRIQNTVCDALAIFGDTRAVPALIELAQQTKNPHAVRALGELRCETALDFLMKILKDEHEAYLRAEAAEAIGRIALLPRKEFTRAIPTLQSVLINSSSEDAMVQREVMLALARINDSLAVPVIMDYAKRQHSGQALRNLLDVTTILGDKWLMPILGQWLQDWRYHNLDLGDIQLLLDYLVATSHRDMVQVLIEALQTEISAEAQAQFASTLSQLTGKNFGEINHPVFNLDTDNANRRVVNKWQKWWKHAQKDSLYSKQMRTTN